jgi:hypothetical protein
MAKTMLTHGIMRKFSRELRSPIGLFSEKAIPEMFIIMYKMISARPVSKPYFKAILAVEGVVLVESIVSYSFKLRCISEYDGKYKD